MTTMNKNAAPAGAPQPDRELMKPLVPARPIVPSLGGFAICLLLAVAQIALAGYQVGVGNQSIQITFLKSLADPSLYPNDEMVKQTMALYPSFFFKMLAPLLHLMDVNSLYVTLQILTSFLTLSAVYWLSRGIYRTHTAALAAVSLLVAGHLHALAGDTLYSEGFTHTFAALPIAVLAIALAYRGWWVTAFAVTGVLFNIHALTAAYAMLMLGAAMLVDLRDIGFWNWVGRTARCAAVAGALAIPTLKVMVTAHQNFGGSWLDLMRIRSADHSFPSTWWATGDPSLPRFALLLGLFVLSWSFTPVRRATLTAIAPEPEDPDAPAGDRITAMKNVRRAAHMSVMMTLAVLGLFAIGWLFTEVWPNPTIIRLQPFRASRLLMILMIVHIAHGAISAIRASVSGRALATNGQWVRLPKAARAAEMLAGVLILLTLGLPSMIGFLPVTLLIAVMAALIAGHISSGQAFVVTLSLLVAVLANLRIEFPLALIASEGPVHSGSGPAIGAALQKLGWFALLDAVAFGLAIAWIKRPASRLLVIAVTAVIGVALAGILFTQERAQAIAGGDADLAAWIKDHLKNKNDVFLTPSGFANFRVQAERSIVADWRDGTQLYFCGAFGDTWLKRVKDIEPGLTLTPDGHHMVTRGDTLDVRSDQELLDLAKQYKPNSKNAPGDCLIILKTPPKDHPRSLVALYSDDTYTLYAPRLAEAAAARPVPPGVLNALNWNEAERFMSTTVQQNIEKYRKSDVALQVVDQEGRPLQGAAVKFDQTQSAFTFGASLGFFDANTSRLPYADGDQIPSQPVRPVELEKMPEVFNGSMIPFSSKWAFIEPYQGVHNWTDLDKYVDYCTKNNIAMEYHHLTGIRPEWIAQMGGHGATTGLDFPAPLPALQAEFNRHCMDVLDRYGDKIKYYQVVNEKYMMEYVPAAWKLLKAKYPAIQFGISDCVNFWDPSMGSAGSIGRGILSGLARGGRGGENLESKGMDSIKWLVDKGIKPDFFSIHGHHPANLWADPREMYAILDKCAALNPGLRIHITEEYLQLDGAITGPLRTGILTPALQADYLVRYFTIAFSHPAVDLVNLWGGLAYTGWTNSGLLDSKGNPTPGFDALKKLLNETFRSHVSGELGLDGSWNGRVFQGTYQVTLTTDDGREIKATVQVPAHQESTRIKLRVDREKGTVEVVKEEKP